MTEAGGDLGNLNLLLRQLEEGSLARKLVEAWRDAEPDDREAALKRVADERMQELRSSDGRTDD